MLPKAGYEHLPDLIPRKIANNPNGIQEFRKTVIDMDLKKNPNPRVVMPKPRKFYVQPGFKRPTQILL